jgi:hypothetical protein
MVLPFFFPARLILRFAGPEGAKNLAGNRPPPDSDPLEKCSLEKITPASSKKSATAESPLQVPRTQSVHPSCATEWSLPNDLLVVSDPGSPDWTDSQSAYPVKGSSLRKRRALLLLNQLDVRGIDEAVVAHIRAVVCAVGMLTAVASHNAEIGPVDNAVTIHIPQEQTHRD